MENKKDEQKALQYQGIKITGRLIETSNQYNINFNNEHITSSVITNIVNVPPDDIHEKLLEG